MLTLRSITAIMFTCILGYTIIAISNDGWNLVPIFIGSLISMTWQGQFNADFVCYLMLSALWIAWRHNFSNGGIVMALAASLCGMLFFAAYLFVQAGKANNDLVTLLLGQHTRNKPQKA